MSWESAAGRVPTTAKLAEWYVTEMGWEVTPFYEIRDSICICSRGKNCSNPGKHPASVNGHKESSRDLARIREYWKSSPTRNIAIALEANNLIDLDVDSRNGGDKTYRRLFDKLGPDAFKTFGYDTGRGDGGFHLLFRRPTVGRTIEKNISFGGIDVRVRGAAVAPPSMHAAGDPYVLHLAANQRAFPAVEMPQSLVEALLDAGETPPSNAPTPTGGNRIAAGKRWTELRSLAGSLRRRGLRSDAIERALLGFYRDLCEHDPPMSDSELHGIALGIGSKPTGADDPTEGVDVNFIPLSDIERKNVDWLWRDRIPKGMLTLLVGDPGGGKSFTTMAIAAAMTAGRQLPGNDKGFNERAEVLLVNYEDSAEHTIAPRADKCGVDGSRLHLVKVSKAGKEIMFSLDHLAEVESKLDAHPNIKLLVIDPVASLLGGVNTDKDAAVRAAIGPLVQFAQRRGIAILCVMHLRKQEAERIIYRVGGSIGFVACARSVLLVGVEPNSGRRSVVAIKHNLCVASSAIEFEIGDAGFMWIGEAPDLDAQTLLGPTSRRERSTHVRDAIDFLKETLAGGIEVARAEIVAGAAALGISPKSLRKAFEALEVRSRGQGYGGGTYWRLPEARNL